MNILQLVYFMELAKSESFRKTAEVLYVSQPAVSKQITNLEKELGLVLFMRGYRSVALTPAGRLLFDALVTGQELYTEALLEAKSLEDYNATKINFGILENSNLGNLFDIVQEFQKDRPDIEVNIERVSMASLRTEFPDGKYDIILIHDSSLKNVREIERKTIGTARIWGLISENHQRGKDPALALQDLKNECFFVPANKNDSVSVDYALHICALHGFVPWKLIILPNVESVLLAVKMGRGVAILDELNQIPAHYGIRVIPTNITFNVLLAWHKKNDYPAIRALADEICLRLKLEHS